MLIQVILMNILKRLLVAILLLVSTTIFVSQYVLTAFYDSRINYSDLTRQNDFFHYYNSASAAVRGEEVYCREFPASDEELKLDNLINTSTNPPALVALTLPLALFSPSAAWWIWTLILATCTLASAFITCRGYKFSVGFSILIALVLISSSPALQSFRFAQVQPVILLSLVGTLHYARLKRDGIAGLLLGLTIGLKFFTLPLLFFFFAAKRYQGCFAAIVTAIAINIPFILSPNLSIFSFHECASGTIIQWAANSTGNQSIFGLSKNFLAMIFAADNQIILGLNQSFSNIVSYAIVVPCLVAILCGSKLSHKFEYGFGVSVAATVFLSPLAWHHYFILLFIPLSYALFALPYARLRFIYGLMLWCLAPIHPSVFALREPAIMPTSPELLIRFGSWFFAFVPGILFTALTTILILKAFRRDPWHKRTLRQQFLQTSVDLTQDSSDLLSYDDRS